MLQWKRLYEQLKGRRVIRTAVLYLALFWGAIEVADLLAGAEMLVDSDVRLLMLVGALGFPLVLVVSWFVESPWKKRHWLSVLGDISVIVAIVIAVLLFAREQFLTSFTRPLVAIIRLEPTDTRADTRDLANHLSQRFRMLLGTLSEIRVIELASSQSPLLSELPVADKAVALNADLLIGGTVNQGSGEVRLDIQLFGADGQLLWSERFSDRLMDQAQLQNRVLNEIWPHLPLSDQALEGLQQLVMQCEYPANSTAIQAIAAADAADNMDTDARLQTLNSLIDDNQDNGLLHLARARLYFAALETAQPGNKPILHNLARRDLDQAVSQCPGHPDIEILRLYNSLEIQGLQDSHSQFLTRFPNESWLRYELATNYKDSGDFEAAKQMAAEAWTLNPLDTNIMCFYRQLLQLGGNTEARDKLDAPELTNIICPER